MAKIDLILYKWKILKDGKNPIMLRVSKGKSRKFFSTGLNCIPNQANKPNHWNDEYGLFVKDKRLEKDYEELNEVLSGKKNKAANIIKEFDRLGIDWTMKQFENAFQKKTVNLSPAVFFENHIQKLKDKEKFGNAEVFNSTLVILRIFDKKFNALQFPDIDTDYIQKFDDFLRKTRELKDTSISVYMRTFATLLNSAITEGLMQPNAYPFSKSPQDKGYKISKLNIETRKRFIPIEYLQKLKGHQFEDMRLEIARNLFLFSFYCGGINWIDMALLTPENIKNEISREGKPIKTIRFIRTKTHKEIEIVINSDIQKLLKWFKSMPHCQPYLLPIVSRPEHTGEAMRKHIHDRLSKYNNALNDIVKIEELKFPESLQKITSYFSRHSFAMALRGKGISKELISEALGHADQSTTDIYLDSFGRDAVATASKNLI
jgi:site-specific recombinase XerD